MTWIDDLFLANPMMNESRRFLRRFVGARSVIHILTLILTMIGVFRVASPDSRFSGNATPSRHSSRDGNLLPCHSIDAARFYSGRKGEANLGHAPFGPREQGTDHRWEVYERRSDDSGDDDFDGDTDRDHVNPEPNRAVQLWPEPIVRRKHSSNRSSRNGCHGFCSCLGRVLHLHLSSFEEGVRGTRHDLWVTGCRSLSLADHDGDYVNWQGKLHLDELLPPVRYGFCML